MTLFTASRRIDGSTLYRSRTSGRSYALTDGGGCFFVSSVDARLEVTTKDRETALRIIEMADNNIG